MLNVRGAPQELLAAYDRYEQGVDARGGPHPGLLVHVCTPSPDGIAIIEVWASEAAFHEWHSRTPDAQTPKLQPVHDMRVSHLAAAVAAGLLPAES